MHAPDVVPPIPITCAHRPTRGGVVLPWVNVQLADGGVDFRAQHQARSSMCWRLGLCQLCGTPLTAPIVLMANAEHLRRLIFDEPPLHPECALYVSRACPMIAGRMPNYAAGPSVSAGPRGKRCRTPGCDCGGVVAHPDLVDRYSPDGRPALAWWALWVRSVGPASHIDTQHLVTDGICTPDDIIRAVQVSAPGQGRIWRRVPVTEALADYEPPSLQHAGEVTGRADGNLLG